MDKYLKEYNKSLNPDDLTGLVKYIVKRNEYD